MGGGGGVRSGIKDLGGEASMGQEAQIAYRGNISCWAIIRGTHLQRIIKRLDIGKLMSEFWRCCISAINIKHLGIGLLKSPAKRLSRHRALVRSISLMHAQIVKIGQKLRHTKQCWDELAMVPTGIEPLRVHAPSAHVFELQSETRWFWPSDISAPITFWT